MMVRRRNANQPDAPQTGTGLCIARVLVVLMLISVPVSWLRAQETIDRNAAAPPKRLSVAVLGLENRTHDPELAHWRCATVLLTQSLKEVKAVRVLPEGAARYALCQVGLQPGDPIDPNRARQMGGHIEAQRVLWGSYSKNADRWQVVVRVMNVAAGTVSGELAAEASDWFDVRDKLNEQILTELGITPSPSEQEKMAERWTRSAEALDSYLRGSRADEQGKPASEVEAYLRKAVAADPNAALAYGHLAASLATQGKLDLAETVVQKALELRPDSARAHYVLGWLRMIQRQLEQAEAALCRVSQLDPDDAECLVDLARICLAQRNSDEAAALLEKAVALDRTAAVAHACLAGAYAIQKRQDDAVRELAEARRYLPEGVHAANALSSIAAAYEMLGRRSEAIEYHERTLPLARELGANPNMIRLVEKRIEQIKSTLTPTFIQASIPRRYTPEELEDVLRDKLTDSERQFAVDPFACTDAMRQWAKELTRGADNDLDKARAIFNELSARHDIKGSLKNRTAKEVFDAWRAPQVRLVCMDHAVLFVALARAVDVNAFLVSVTRMPDGTVVGHACAAVFVADRTLLVDSAQRWFGAPHKEYTILDDLQAMAALCFVNWGTDDPTELAAYRAGSKLWPKWVTGRLTLVAGLIRAGQVQEARQVFAEIPQPQSEDYEAAVYWSLAGEPALAEKNWDRAKECLLKSITICPGESYAYFNLGRVYVQQHRLADARRAFRACLRNDPKDQIAAMARAAIVQINEEIGVDTAPDAAPERKPQ